MNKKTSHKTKSNLPSRPRRSLKLLDLKPKQNPKGGLVVDPNNPNISRLTPIKDGTSNTIMLKSG